MGVHGLWDLLSPVGHRVSNEHVQNKVLAIDISIWLTQFVKAMRDAEGATLRNAHLLGVLRRCLKLLFLSVKPVVIFDGETPAIKRRTVSARRAQREKHTAKLRRLAEKMVLNQMKSHAVTQAINIRKGRQSGLKQVIPSVDAVPAVDSQPVSDEIGVASKNSLSQDKAYQAQGELVSDREDLSSFIFDDALDFTEDPISLPTNLDEIDDDTLLGLPPNLQSEVFKQIKLVHRARHRKNMMLRKKDPAAFSNIQIEGFLRNSALNRKISNARTMINSKSGASQRIASDSRRQFLLQENAANGSDIDEDLIDLDEDELQDQGASVHRSTMSSNDILFRIRMQRDAKQLDSHGHIKGKLLTEKQDQPSGVGWASRVLEGNGGLSLRHSNIGNALLPDDSYSDDDKFEQVSLPTKANNIGCIQSSSGNKHDGNLEQPGEYEKRDNSDSDDMEWEDGAEPTNYDFGDISHIDETREEQTISSAKNEKKNCTFSSIGSTGAPVSPEMIDLSVSRSVSNVQGVELRTADEPESPEMIDLSPPEVISNVQDAPLPTSDIRSQGVESPKVESDRHAVRKIIGEGQVDIVQSNQDEVNASRNAIDSQVDNQDHALRTEAQKATTKEQQTTGFSGVQSTKSHQTEEDEITPNPVSYSVRMKEKLAISSRTHLSPDSLEPSTTQRLKESEYLHDGEIIPSRSVARGVDKGLGRGPTNKQSLSEKPIAIAKSSDPATTGEEAMSLSNMEVLQEQLEKEAQQIRRERSSRQGAVELVSDEMYGETIALLQILGIPYLQAPMEAEAQCAFLNMQNVVHGVITEDSDVFLFGGKSVYRQLFSEGKFAEVYESCDVEKNLGLTREHLIRLAYLLGSDYTPGVRGVGVVNAMEILEAFRGSEGLSEFRVWAEKFSIFEKEPENTALEGSSAAAVRRRFCWKHRNMKRNWHIREGFPNPSVFDAYKKPAVDQSTETFRWKPVDFDSLETFCWEKFGWEKERFDTAVGPLRRKLKDFSGIQQSRIDQFFKPHRFAKIRSERLKEAVKGMAGEEAKELMAKYGPSVRKRNARVMSYTPTMVTGENASRTTPAGETGMISNRPSKTKPLKRSRTKKST